MLVIKVIGVHSYCIRDYIMANGDDNVLYY